MHATASTRAFASGARAGSTSRVPAARSIPTPTPRRAVRRPRPPPTAPDRPHPGPRGVRETRAATPSRRATTLASTRARGPLAASSSAVPASLPASSSDEPDDRRKSAVVVGAGPAGALAAVYLANLGWRVRVFERRPPGPNAPRDAGTETATGTGTGTNVPERPPDRSYNVVLTPRGLGALDAAGVVLPESRAVRLAGNVRHLPGATTRTSQFRGAVAVNRGALADAIVDAATRAGESAGGSVEFHHRREVRAVDFASRRAEFIPVDESNRIDGSNASASAGPASSVSYDLLVAADGVNSAVRRMLRDDGSVAVEQNTDEMEFKTVRLPPPTDPDHRDAFHVWPSGLASMLAPPDPEGTLSAVLILPGAGVERGKGKKKTETWDEIRTEDDVAALFRDVFPDAFGVDGEDGTPVAPPRETIRDVLRQRARPGGITTTCSHLVAHGGSVALVGDAAHSVWPSLGQGANAALETSMYLGAAIESKPDDLAGAMRYFDEVRGPQVRAVGRLSESGFGGKNRRAGNAAFFAKLAALSLLHRVCPLLFDKPALTRINDPAWGYDDVEEETRAETGTLFAVAVAVAAAVAGARWFGVAAVAEVVGAVVRAVVVGDSRGEGVAVAALGIVAAVTAVYRAVTRRARRRRERKGNVTDAMAARFAAAEKRGT